MSSAEEIVLDDGTIHEDLVPMPMAEVDIDTTVAVTAGYTAITTESALKYFSVSGKGCTLGTLSPGATGANSGYIPYSYGKYVGNFAVYTNGSKLNIPKGAVNMTFGVSNLTYALKVYNASSQITYNKTLSVSDFLCSSVRVTYSDSSYEFFYDIDCLTTTSHGLLSFTYTLPEVTRQIEQVAFCAWVDIGGLTGLYSDSGYTEDYQVIVTLGTENLKYTIEYEESTNSLLDNIIGWLSDIKDSIVNLPALIWDKISEGLKSLFIPSEEDMTAIKTDWENLFRDRFGALYEAGEIISSFMDNFTYLGEQTTVDVPSVNVNLGSANFAFGGWTIDLVPAKFAFFVDVLKSAISIICTLLFVNTLRNKFNKLVGDHT